MIDWYIMAITYVVEIVLVAGGAIGWFLLFKIMEE